MPLLFQHRATIEHLVREAREVLAELPAEIRAKIRYDAALDILEQMQGLRRFARETQKEAKAAAQGEGSFAGWIEAERLKYSGYARRLANLYGEIADAKRDLLRMEKSEIAELRVATGGRR